MEIPISHEKLQGQRISLRTAGLFSGAKILSNGNPIKGKGNKYILRDSQGAEVIVIIKNSLLDPIPKIEIDKDEIQLARPLTWYEYTWMGLPIILVFAGGALGAIIGFTAAYSSSRIFRSERSTAKKYLVTGAISFAAVILFLGLAVAIDLLIHGVPEG